LFVLGAVQIALGAAVVGLPAEAATRLLKMLLFLSLLAAALYSSEDL
jgi:hypothetical protein